jgi:GNAT superfamily N-acetyltransferase
MTQIQDVTTIKTVQLQIPEDLKRAFEVIKELRPHLDLEEFTRLVQLARAGDGYRLVARELRGKVVAVMGFRILHDLVHGSHLYIDDLVTTKDRRSEGHGAELLRFAEAEARRLGLTGLRLCTGIENEAGRKFYEREGWVARSLAFKKKVSNH